MKEIQSEFERLEAVYRRIGRNVNRQAPATDEEIASIAATTGVEIDDSLKAIWRLSNGSAYTMWFAVGNDDFTPYYLLSVDNVLERWRKSTPHEWYEDEAEWGERDSRIQKHIFFHRAWVPFAEFNGGSHALFFDAAPSSAGEFGQIINYIHDPDFMYWRSMSFLELFRTSNDTLEKWLDDPDELRDELGLWE